MIVPWLLALQALTNLPAASPGAGLPDGWKLHRPRKAAAPTFAVTGGGVLGVEASAAAGFAVYRLREPIPPSPGTVGWRWRTPTPIDAADLRAKPADDSPVRLLVVFRDDRMLFYSWGNREPVGDTFPSWTGDQRVVIVLRRADDATGAWHEERRDPFEDYRTAFGRAPPGIVAVAVSVDTDMLGSSTRAEVADIAWHAAGR